MNLQNDVREYMKDWLYHYIDDYCIDRRDMRDKSANNPYSYMFYMRNGLFNSTFANYVGCLFWDRYSEIYKETPFQISGLETAATPVVMSILMTSAAFDIENLNCFIIRKEKKEYGLKQRFEGNIIKELPVLLVDDFCNEGLAIMKAKKYIEEENLKLYKNAFTIVSSDFKEFDVDCIIKKESFNCSYQSYELNKAYEKNMQKSLDELYNS